jgi:bacteriocin biosynthesis cyclodehydratase domain-containing protein
VLFRDPLLHLHDALLVIRGTASASGIPEHPALAPWCRLVEDGGRMLLEHGGTLVTIEGAGAPALLPELLPLLDGTRTVEEIGIVLGPAIAPAVAKALELLAGNRLLVDGPQRSPDENPVTAAATLAAAVTRRTTQAEAIRTLAAASVSVLGSGPEAEELGRQLDRAGIGRTEVIPFDAAPASGSFVVAAPGRADVPSLLRVNELMLELGDAWMQVLPFDGRFVVAGPIVVPGASACRACFVSRRAACSGYEDDFALVEDTPARAPSPIALVTIAAALAAVLVVRWLTAQDPTLPGRFYALEMGAVLRLRFDHCLRVPRCAVCGGPERAVPSPWFEGGV